VNSRLSAALLLVLVVPLFRSAAPVQAAAPVVARLDGSLLDDPAWQGDGPAALMNVVVELDGPSTLDLYRATPFGVGDARPEAHQTLEAIFERVADRQAPARAFVEGVGGRIVSTYDTAANGFLVTATRAQVEAMTAGPGVLRVYRAPYYTAELNDAVPLVGADQVAADFGFTGKGVTIAVIDTGIDYNHLSLGGSGKKKDFTDNDPITVERRSFPTAKVVGGYDFAGTDYTGNPSPAPKPDNDPLDQAGHGTHVAAIAAGMRDNPKVYHGVAPDASLLALKVFGARGGTNLSNDAIEWAIEANLGHRVDGICPDPCRVDVINMSLGAAWANNVTGQMGVMKRAVEAGIIVIASAGNDGDAAFITGAPGATPYAISVASTFPGGEAADKIVALHDGTSDDIEAVEADGGLAPQIAAIGDLQGVLAWYGGPACGDEPTGELAERVVLIERGGCSFGDKILAAEAKGAVAVVIYSTVPSVDKMGLAQGGVKANVPAYMISMEDGLELRQLLQDGVEVEVRMSPGYRGAIAKDYLTDVVSGFSSRGPSRGGELKPNISAPGSNIVSASMGGGDEPRTLSGTSMAAPITAGAAAVLVERLRAEGLAPVGKPLNDPALLDAAEIGALLVNTAQATVWSEDNRNNVAVPLARQGAGRVDLRRAVTSDTIVRAGAIAGLTYGIQPFLDTHTTSLPFTVRNISDAPKHYRISTEFPMADDADAGVRWVPSATELEVAAGESANLSLRVVATSTDMKPYRAYGGQAAMNGDGGLTDAEFDTLLFVTEVDDAGDPVPGGDISRVPVYFLPRAASAMKIAPAPVLISPTTGHGPATVSNADGGPGTAEMFALAGEDEVEANVDKRLNVDQVGLRYGKDAEGKDTVDIVVHTTGARQMPLDSMVRVFLDINDDGDLDWMAYNWDLGAITGRGFNGQQIALAGQVVNQSPVQWSNVLQIHYFAEVSLSSRTVILHLAAERLGIAAGDYPPLKAVVLHQPNFGDIRGAVQNAGYDIVPNDGLTVNGEGQFVAGAGRVSFDPAGLGLDLDRWSLTIEGGATADILLDRVGGGMPIGQLLAVYPMNMPQAGDTQIIAFAEGEPPTPVPTVPTATRRPPTPTPGPTNTPPFGGRPVGVIFLPANLRASGF